jgi:hypothetical protein
MKMFSNKPKVLVCVLTGSGTNWVNPYLVQNLITMSQDTRFAVQVEMVKDKHPVDYARNCCVVMARERKVDFLFMADHDQSFEVSPLDVLHAGLGKDIVALPTMQTGPDSIFPNIRTLQHPEKDGEFFTVEKAGTGALFLSRRVWEKIPGPWFKTVQADDELRTPHTHGEDFYACELFLRHGFKVWAHSRVIPHWKTIEVAKLGMYLQTLHEQEKHNGKR